MMVQIFLLFIVCLSQINNVLCILQLRLLVPTPGYVMYQCFCYYVIACSVDK